MQSYLYNDLFELEETHWWHRAKRALVIESFGWLESKGFISKITKKKSTLLDVGCGTGKNLEAFSKYSKTHGVDFSSEAIAFCKARGQIKVKQAPAEKLPYKDNTFQLVTALDVIEHVDDKKAIKEIKRVLQPNGVVIVTVPAYQWLWSQWDEVLHHKKRYNKQQLANLFEAQGFKILKKSYVYSFLLIPVIVVRSIKSLFQKESYGSDFRLSHPFVNACFAKISKLERWFLWRFSIPTGTSVFLVAQKADDV